MLALHQKVAVHRNVPEYAHLEGDIMTIEYDRESVPIYSVYLYRLTALVKFREIQLVPERREQ